MEEGKQIMVGSASALWVPAGQDRFGEVRGNGVATIEFKVATQDCSGLFLLEMTFFAKGGPPRHIHLEQDEWFYPIEGEMIVEVGQDRFRLGPGDSLFAPRKIPHVWAYVSDNPGRALFAVTPPGRIEAFLRAISQANAMAPQDPGFWPPFDMELVGPPLALG